MDTNIIKYKPVGNIRLIWAERSEEVLVEGKAGTGKTRGILEKLDLICRKYPKARVLICRQTRVSLTHTVMSTYEQYVQTSDIIFNSTKQAYLYPNGSVIVVGGLDKPEKVLSSEWDIIYINEGTEVLEATAEILTTRLRSNIVPYQQLIIDCNPSFANHWLNLRANTSKMVRIVTTHEDNPIYYNSVLGEYTELGKKYILGRLAKLSGVLRLRYFLGIWANNEGLVYPTFKQDVHVLKPFTLPKSWVRYRAFDFGYTNPFVCQFWVLVPTDFTYTYTNLLGKQVEVLIPENSLIMYKEIYHSKRTVSTHAVQINELTEEENLRYKQQVNGRYNPLYYYGVSDHSAGDRATLEEHGINTTPAYKDISVGIQGVLDRLDNDERTGRPLLYFFEGATVEIDVVLEADKYPTSTVAEFSVYEWATNTKGVKEVPVDKHNHGMDTVRYLVAFVDNLGEQDEEEDTAYTTIATPVNYSNII